MVNEFSIQYLRALCGKPTVFWDVNLFFDHAIPAFRGKTCEIFKRYLDYLVEKSGFVNEHC
jgi:hypothetical protein